MDTNTSKTVTHSVAKEWYYFKVITIPIYKTFQCFHPLYWGIHVGRPYEST